MSYFKSNGVAPTGNFQGEDALNFNPENSMVSLEPINYDSFSLKSWKLVAGNSVLLSLMTPKFKPEELRKLLTGLASIEFVL
ncbi:MAG: hypothetical protein HC831_07000 [Chloroflexia bacterium]|nr:hypothetical protein [Chloroflexia bacterium]